MTPTIPTTIMKELLHRIANGMALSESEAEAAFEVIMSGEATPAQIGALLMGLRVRGETVAEITGAARILRAKALTLEAPAEAIDTCGTGGDAAGTYNISTAAAFIIAGCGVPVAKHGNRALSSRSGSADVLKALGVNIDADFTALREALAEAKICFMMAPRHHSAMRYVMPVRAELGTRTLFNLLGPLSNPAGTRRQVVGVFSADWVQPLAEVLGRLGAERAWVVHGHDGLDEITTTGPTDVAEYRDGAVNAFTVTPEAAGLPLSAPEDLKGGDAAHNAAAMRAVFDGAPGPLRDIALFNAAAGLMVADRVASLKEGVAQAAAAVDEGRAKAALDALIAITNRGA
ncbi:MAG: anthranilate phosphoribosyltransferase [Rhodospirillaceae bacterium]|nr:MAG: anthranilate phosphoribosyltransferase [Rhodospirillaceae bacterium]